MPGQQQKSKNTGNPKPIPENEIKQNSSASAGMALQAMQKAYDLRQAANAAGDPDAREEILAKAVNKEIEAESFGKAAKYTRSGTFQGLAAGAGLGVQPGVTLGKLTGAVVGGTVSTVTGLLGGGVGSVYGAMHGPFWDIGSMASQGVRSIVGDFPNWKSTPSQKKALEKMVMQTRETQAPSQEELEKLKSDDGGAMPDSWAQSAKDMTSYLPSMPSMPSMPSIPNMPNMPSMPSLGGQSISKDQPSTNKKTKASQQQQAKPSAKQQTSSLQTQQASTRKGPSKPKEAPTPKEVPKLKETPKTKEPAKSTGTSKPSQTSSQAKSSGTANTERKKPRKLNRPNDSSVKPNPQPTTEKKKPRKLEMRSAA